MKKSTPFWATLGCLLLSLSILATAGEPASMRSNFGPSPIVIKPKLTGLPIVNAHTRGVRIQSASEYRVIDSLFNAYSFYGGEQQPLSYEPNTGLFAIIKRGALPPENTGNPNNSNSLRLLLSTNLGQTWLPSFPLYSSGSAGSPRYPSVEISVPEGRNILDEAIFCYTSPLTKSNGTTTAERSWDGNVIGYQTNDLTSPPAYNEMTAEFDINGSKFWWGTECTSTSYRTAADDKLVYAFSVDLIPSDSAVTDPADVNAVALWRKDFYASGKPIMTVPDQWASGKFRAVTAASTRTRTHVGMCRDEAGNFYNAVFGFPIATDADSTRTFAVSKSTDHGATWSEFNIMPTSVYTAYEQAQGCAPGTTFFDWRRSTTDPSAAIRLTTYGLVCYGPDKYSCFTQFYVTDGQPANTHMVECYYENGQWGMRKVANVSMFENADMWRAFDQDGSAGPSQMGNEFQACVTADRSTLVCKFLEAKIVAFKNESNDDDTLISTDVVVCTRKVGESKWSVAKNVTQSDIADRTTWMPTILPSDLKKIPLVTIQTADKGTTIREQLFDSQMRMATSNAGNYDMYKQYVCISNFNVADLPDFAGLAPVDGVRDEDNELNKYLILAPNPATNELTVRLESDAPHSSLQIINALGQTVYTQNVDQASAGLSYVTLNTNQLSSGSYVVRMTAGAKVYSKSLTIVR